MRAAYARSGAYLSVEAIANDGHDDQTGWGLSAGRAPGDLDVDEAARDAVGRATRDARRGEARLDEVPSGL